MVVEDSVGSETGSHRSNVGGVNEPAYQERKRREKAAKIAIGTVSVGVGLGIIAAIVWVVPMILIDAPNYSFEVIPPWQQIYGSDIVYISGQKSAQFEIYINSTQLPSASPAAVRVCYEAQTATMNVESQLAPMYVRDSDSYGSAVVVVPCNGDPSILYITPGLVTCPDSWQYTYTNAENEDLIGTEFDLYVLLTECDPSVEFQCACPSNPYDGGGVLWILVVWLWTLFCSCACVCGGLGFCIVAGICGARAAFAPSAERRQLV